MKTRFLLLLTLLMGAVAVQAQPLLLRCQTNKTVECASAWDFDPPLGYINACPPTGLATITVLDTVTNGPCPLIATRTWKVTDDCGNMATCSQSVTNLDTIAPVLTCASNKTVECGSQWDFDPPTAFDSCTATADLIFSVVSTVTNFSCPTVFTATRIWEVADLCDNKAACTQSVAVVDTTLPVLSCQCLATPGVVELTVTACSNAIPDLCAIIANCASDNCGPLTCTQSPPAGTIVLPGVHPITVTVTDCASNSATCVVDFTVVVPALRIICPPPIGVQCGTPFALNPPPAQSLCCGTNVTVTALSTATNGVCPQFVQRVWQATDCFGQTATCTQTVAIVDITPPTFCVDSSASNLVFNGSFEINWGCPFNFSGQIGFATGWSNPTLGSSDYFHPCAGNPALGVPNNVVGNQAAFDGQAYAGIHGADTETSAITPLREYIQTQLTTPLVAGRTYNVSFRVSLSDPATRAVDNLGAFLSVTAPSSGSWAPLPFVPQVRNPAGSFLTDKTGWTLIQGDFIADGSEEYLTIGNFYNNALTPTVALAGTTNWAYYYIDDVRVVETCCRGRIVECPASGIFEPPPALDDCFGTNVTVTLLTGTSTSPGCTQVHTLVWQAADPCGNTTTCTQRVTVVDTTAPVIACPANITRTICSNSEKVHYKATATDACSLPVTVVCVPPSGTTFSLGTSLVTCTATDACGNSNSCSFTVTVVNGSIWQLLPCGINDCYAPLNEPTLLGACLTAANPGPWKPFDSIVPDRRVGHTWNFPATWNILGAQLLMRARPPVNGCAGGSANDTISLGLNNCASPANWAWSRFFGTGNASAGLVNAQWCNGSGCQYMFAFNLAALPLAAGGTTSLLPQMNAADRLDLFVQDDTTVDFANLRVLRCAPQVLGGVAIVLSNAVLVQAPVKWCLAPVNPELALRADFSLGEAAGLRLPVDPLALADYQGGAVEFGSADPDGVFPVGYVFPRLALGSNQDGGGEVRLNGLPPGVPVIDLAVLVNGVEVQSASVPASEGMLLATFDMASPLVELALANGSDLLATLVESSQGQQSSRVTLRVRLPGYTSGFPGASLLVSGAPEVGVEQPELQLPGTSDRPPTYIFAWGTGLAGISGGQGVVSSLENSTGAPVAPMGFIASFPPTNELRATIQTTFGQFAPTPSNASLTVAFTQEPVDPRDGQQEVALNFAYTGSEWTLTARAGFVPLWLTYQEVRLNGTNVAAGVNPTNIQVMELPDNFWAAPAWRTFPPRREWCYRFPYPRIVPVRVNGTVYLADELLVVTADPGPETQTASRLRVEVSGAEAVSLARFETGAVTYRLDPPSLENDDIVIRGNTLGASLESAPTVSGPWATAFSESGESRVKITNAPNMYYRVKGR